MLFELVLVIAMGSLITIWAASRWLIEEQDARAQATGIWLQSVKKGVDSLMAENAVSFRAQTIKYRNSHGVNLLNSTGIRQLFPFRNGTLHVQDLVNSGHLSKEFTHHPPMPYDVRILAFSVDIGACLAKGCQWQAITIMTPHASESYKATDTNRLGMILQALNGQGLVVHPFSPNRLKGTLGDYPNPPLPGIAALPQGSVALLSSYLLSTTPKEFGGAFVAQLNGACINRQGDGLWINPFTNACSCPDGFEARIISEWRQPSKFDTFGAGELIRGFICLPPL